MDDQRQHQIAVIGAGPAGLMAAEILSAAGMAVTESDVTRGEVDWAEEQGAVFVETGLWMRSSWFPREGEDWLASASREVLATRGAVGICARASGGNSGSTALPPASARKARRPRPFS